MRVSSRGITDLKYLYAAMQLRFVSTGTAKLQASKMQLGRILNKVMQSDRTKRNRKASVDPPALPANFIKRPVPAAPITTHKNRRVTILNKVFMKYITDLMATGEVGSNLVGRGIEISHVTIAPDFSLVNVYWFAHSQANADKSVEKILQVSAGHLQHELSQLRVIGLVPPINFVKNRHYGVIKDVEDRLAMVDFGDDYVPSAAIPSAKAPILTTSLSAELRARISLVDGSNLNDDGATCEIAIPEMRQDIMGFDHGTVMNKVKSSINKTRIAERSSSSVPTCCSELTSQQVVEFLSSKEQSELFSDFLKKRTMEEKRKQRSVSLFEVKMQEERDWVERMENECNDEQQDLNIDEPYRDEYNDDLESK